MATRRAGLVTAVLEDPSAERVRKSHHRAIAELQRAIDNLKSPEAVAATAAAVGGWNHVAKTEVLANTNSIAVNGSDINDVEIRIVGKLEMSIGTTKQIGIQPTAATSSDLDSGGSQQGAPVAYSNQWAFIQAANTPNIDVEFRMDPRAGRERSFYARGMAGIPGSVAIVFVSAGIWNNTSDLTGGLTLTSSQASSILAGTTLDLYTRPLI